MEISQILDKIDDNQLFVPAFQREYVWKRDHAKYLINSLIKGYPTGTMLTWETSTPPELKGKWKYSDSQGAVKLILDGQQRITTLYILIRDKIPPYYTDHEIKTDITNLHVNVENLELEYFKKTKMENNPLWVNITDIFKKKVRTRDVIRALKLSDQDVPDEREDVIDENFKDIESILSRNFLEQTIPVKASIKEAIDIFYIVNASGVNLTDAELALAQISGYWPAARDLIKAKLQTLEKSGFVFKLDFMVYVLLGVLHHGGSEMKKLHPQDNYPAIKEAWELLDKQVLDYVFNVMKSHAYIDHTKEINSVYALIPIIVYTFRKFQSGTKHLSQEEIKKIVKWFYYSQIRFRYISTLPQKLDKDIGIIVKSATPFDDLLNGIKLERPLEITTNEFVGVDVRHPLWALMRWYFKSRNAVCFTTGVGIRQNMGKTYSLEWDHIFPFSLLKEAGYGVDNRLKYALAQEITNRAVLTGSANRSKSNKRAEDYLTNVEANHKDALKLQCIPEDTELWKLENFEEFLEVRRQLLTDELNLYLQNITKTADTALETTVEELIADDENSGLEFKSSLRWNYKESKVDKVLEQVIMKAIAAFTNSPGGGTLLMGVNDDGEVLGLEHDFTSLGGNSDEFELHLRNLVNKSFGEGFAATNVTVKFPEVEDKEICQVDIKKAKTPQYLDVLDKGGQKSKKLYVRNGNRSDGLPLHEVAAYVQEVFR
ncbi:MAG: DUF262 domain-containing protein [Dehalococcoidia bacterium]|nr:DUF262 domain-containing protein [Dehalococcoidia bacterium]